MNYDAHQQPQEKKISVELTLNEALALTGVRFRDNHKLEVNAMAKIKRQLEEQIIDSRRNVQ
ncbi:MULTISPECIES: hypothetical protein [Paenibacillus]|uniref:Uncharacterized protein n=1 Tax=Paenibacillus naphthalenovorans TaxID=162209 RepID=A0A0U2VNL9_9BACL|nr:MULTISPECIES: hypothetical protein [Paenibacillus]ALS22342.1 hypothetical protein IJ22_19680 [Paenibacillus naphthalenovorans]NTZ16813.1 hypothetical protein [Paenibacillus sp. JMULE4]GCL70135.1 hypothetical protein PN4B1_00350 [Paenibacillus naphthalenovorans]SDJ56224.1 hypothetical protein SAMN05421868_13217 [Paenibacillus naphthalenovorans]